MLEGGRWLWLNLWFLWFYFDLIQFKTIHYNFPLFISFKCLLLSICLLCRKHTLLLYCFAVCWINICTTSAIYFCANKHDLWNFTVLALEYVNSLFIFQSTIVFNNNSLLILHTQNTKILRSHHVYLLIWIGYILLHAFLHVILNTSFKNLIDFSLFFP